MPAIEFALSEKNPPVRKFKILLTTFRGFLQYRDTLGRIFNLSLEPTMTPITPLTGATVLAPFGVTEDTTYLTPAGTIAALTFTLPSANNSRLGQIRRLQSSQIITALTVNVGDTGAIAGPIISAAAVGVTYEWQYLSAIGTVGTWLRIQ